MKNTKMDSTLNRKIFITSVALALLAGCQDPRSKTPKTTLPRESTLPSPVSKEPSTPPGSTAPAVRPSPSSGSEASEDSAPLSSGGPKAVAPITGEFQVQEQSTHLGPLSYDDGNAWFLDETKTIRYCIEVAGDFGVTKEFVEGELNEAIGQWSDLTSVFNAHRKESKEKTIARDFQELDSCDGTEDLKFLFGVSDPIVVKANVPSDEVAAAIRVNYDVVKGWGHGILWVARSGSVSDSIRTQWPTSPGTTAPGASDLHFPDWSLSYNLLGILLHELGVIHGFDQIPNTIMDERIYYRLAEPLEVVRRFTLGQIEQHRLFTTILYQGEYSTSGIFGAPSGALKPAPYSSVDAYANYEVEKSEMFRMLMGRFPQGRIWAHLQYSYDHGGCIYRLELGDFIRSSRLCIRPDIQLPQTSFEVDGAVFKVSSKDATHTPSLSMSSSSLFYLDSAQGQTYLIAMDSNQVQRASLWHSRFIAPVVIRLLTGEHLGTLFTADSAIPHEVSSWLGID